MEGGREGERGREREGDERERERRMRGVERERRMRGREREGSWWAEPAELLIFSYLAGGGGRDPGLVGRSSGYP